MKEIIDADGDGVDDTGVKPGETTFKANNEEVYVVSPVIYKIKVSQDANDPSSGSVDTWIYKYDPSDTNTSAKLPKSVTKTINEKSIDLTVLFNEYKDNTRRVILEKTNTSSVPLKSEDSSIPVVFTIYKEDKTTKVTQWEDTNKNGILGDSRDVLLTEFPLSGTNGVFFIGELPYL